MAVLNLRDIDAALIRKLDHEAIDHGVTKRELVILLLEEALELRKAKRKAMRDL